MVAPELALAVNEVINIMTGGSWAGCTHVPACSCSMIDVRSRTCSKGTIDEWVIWMHRQTKAPPQIPSESQH